MIHPWGPIDWLLTKLSFRANDTVVLGVIAPEDRCRAVPELAASRGITSIALFEIIDPVSRYSDACTARRDANSEALTTAGCAFDSINTPLLAPGEDIKRHYDSLRSHDPNPFNLWIDMSCLPKRYFFLLVKLALSDTRVDSLLVTYTQPEPGRYTEEHLAGDPQYIRPLPGFTGGPDGADLLIVALGFEALGLPQLLGEYRDRKRDVVLLLPFPPGQPYSKRIWESVIALGHSGKGGDIPRIAAVDAFGTYEVLCRLRDPSETTRPVVLAPYGPKPISLGMCLYALRGNAAVLYTQPQMYHPDYTVGIGDSWGYAIRLNGQDQW